MSTICSYSGDFCRLYPTPVKLVSRDGIWSQIYIRIFNPQKIDHPVNRIDVAYKEKREKKVFWTVVRFSSTTVVGFPVMGCTAHWSRVPFPSILGRCCSWAWLVLTVWLWGCAGALRLEHMVHNGSSGIISRSARRVLAYTFRTAFLWYPSREAVLQNAGVCVRDPDILNGIVIYI